MTMLDIDVDVPKLDGLLPTAEDYRVALRKVGARYLQMQTERLNRGEGADGAPLAPYSQSYAERKTRAGRMGESYWLRLTGKMLRSQSIQVGGAEGSMTLTVGFTGTRARSRFALMSKQERGGALTVVDTDKAVSNSLIAESVDAIRPFVGVSPAEVEILTSVFIEALCERLAARGGGT